MATSLRRPVIWINVTTSVGWTRPPVGIVRVERALAEHVQRALGADVCKLCVWQDGRFVEWIPPPPTAPLSQLEEATDVILPRSSSFDLARPFVMRALQRYAISPSSSSQRDQLQVAIPMAASTRLHPGRGDIVISVGLDWDNQYTQHFYDLSKRDGLRFITCCYDLIPVLFPQYCVGEVAQRFTEYFIQLSWGSEAVLCISEQTERDYTALCRELGAPPRTTVVIPLGDSVPSSGGDIGLQVEALTRKPFILFVSTIERRKNHEVLYRAYHLLARRGLAIKLPTLIFVGMPGWGIGDLLKDIEIDPQTKGKIVQLHHVSDAELNYLYTHATFCVYPSLYEGWGLPVAEALAMGKAVIASAEGSLPEVGGDLVRYVQPWNVYAWADAILELVEQPDLLAELEERIRVSYRPRQWADTAGVVVNLIRTLTGDAKGNSIITLEPGYDMSTHAGVHLGPSMQSTGTSGLLLFGPHASMPAGSYRVLIYAEPQGKGEQCFKIEIASDKGTRIHHEKEIICTRTPNRHAGDVPLELTSNCDDLEIRCHVSATTQVRIDRIDIIPVGVGLASSIPTPSVVSEAQAAL